MSSDEAQDAAIPLDQCCSVQELTSLVADLEKSQAEAQQRCQALERKVKRSTKDLLASIDSCPMDVITTQEIFQANVNIMRIDHLIKIFKIDFHKPVGQAQRREAYCSLRRIFSELSSKAIERALEANLGHFSGSMLMLEAWISACRPERFHWLPLGHPGKAKTIRMICPFEDYRSFQDTKKKEAGENLHIFPSFPVLLEMQFTQTLKTCLEQEAMIGGDTTVKREEKRLPGAPNGSGSKKGIQDTRRSLIPLSSGQGSARNAGGIPKKMQPVDEGKKPIERWRY